MKKQKKTKTTSTGIEGYDEETRSLLHLDTPDDEEKRPKRRMFLFKDIGLVIPIWAVLTLSKTWMIKEKPKTRQVWGIIINKGIEPSKAGPVGEREIWFENEKVRDKHFDDIIGVMQEENFIFSVI